MRFIFWKRDLRDGNEDIKISVRFIYFFEKLNGSLPILVQGLQ
jgi:hypothetical protein